MPASTPPPSAKKIRVAVLDDDLELLRTLSAVFSAVGLDPHQYQSATELLDAVEENPFEAFVVDWLLEGTTAGPVIERLREISTSRSAPIFVLSGNLSLSGIPSDDAMARTIDDFEVQYRLKPYSATRLAKEIKESVEGQ